jgi:hypothetical protein
VGGKKPLAALSVRALIQLELIAAARDRSAGPLTEETAGEGVILPMYSPHPAGEERNDRCDTG